MHFACRLRMVAVLAGILASAVAVGSRVWPSPAQATDAARSAWTVPDISLLPDDRNGRLVRRGRQLIVATYADIGPRVADPANRYAGNNLACANCHLDAGTKMFGLPIFGLFEEYPQYSGRAGAEITIEGRINACMTRSMNGRAMPADAPQMTAIVAYLKFLSQGAAKGELPRGLGAGNMPELNRAADPERGRRIYGQSCAACHKPDGSGIRRNPSSADPAYVMPPLWGADSFNDGAGMNRLITAANFIHFNMPAGTDYLNPQLSAEDAWDVAAYVLAQPRPHKSGLSRDFPDRLDKPVDAPYGPYADHFSERQHKYGPFAPIRQELERLKAEKRNGERAHQPQ
jgi:thiosulfate dehydrogenase